MRRETKRLLSVTFLTVFVSAVMIGCSDCSCRSRSWTQLDEATREANARPPVVQSDAPVPAVARAPNSSATARREESLLTLTAYKAAAATDSEATEAPAAEPQDRPTEAPKPETPARIEFSQVLAADVRTAPRSLWQDTKRVYTNPVNLGILLAGGGATLAVRNACVDDKWEHHFDKHRSLDSCWGDVAGVVGNPGTHFGVAALAYAYGVQAKNAKTYNVGKTLFNALIINDLTTVMLKTAACTESPNGDDWAWPSGHTSSSFCVAAVLDKAYGHWVGFPLYAVAGFVGFERMDDREHYFSDVLFGAVLGYVVGNSVAEGHSPEIFGGEIVPFVDPYQGGGGLAWVKTF